MDLDSVMKKYDRESNVRIWEGGPKIVVTCILAAFSLFCVYVTLFASWLEELRLTSFVAFIILLGYLVFPARKGKQRINHIPWFDWILMILGTGSVLYFTFNAMSIIQQGSILKWYQILIGIIAILSLAEVARRTVGLPILIVAAVFLTYALIWGLTNPSFKGRLNLTIKNLFYSKEGVFSTPINVCSKFIAVFIIFGAFLERSGIADFFIKISNAIVGGFSGGTAKVAVVASALEGMVSGSSVANTVGSGAVTIPLMKKAGYKPEFAAAAEAAASTGGQIMPPIMGAAAFLMADFVQLPYSTIVVKAILPAALYFAGIFIAVHLEAKKMGLKGLSKEELPKLKPLLKQIYLMTPIFLLIYLVSSGSNSIQFAAALSILAAIAVSMFNKNYRMNPRKILDALAAGAQGTITVAAACGIAGIIAGTITMTGLADTMIKGIVALAGDQALLHRAGHGRSHHRQLLHHGSHLCAHSHQDECPRCGCSLLRILFWYRGRSDAPRSSGCLCRCRHWSGQPHKNRLHRHEAGHRRLPGALCVCSESCHAADRYLRRRDHSHLHYLPGRHFCCIRCPGGLDLRPYEVV